MILKCKKWRKKEEKEVRNTRERSDWSEKIDLNFWFFWKKKKKKKNKVFPSFFEKKHEKLTIFGFPFGIMDYLRRSSLLIQLASSGATWRMNTGLRILLFSLVFSC